MWVLILAVNGDQVIWICVNVVDNKKWLVNCTDILIMMNKVLDNGAIC